MRKIFLGVLILGLVIGIGFLILNWISDSSTHRPIDSLTPQLIDPLTRYQCPMHPQVIRNKPGKCPICGMTLVLIQNQKNQNSLQLTPQQEKLLGIHVETVKIQYLHLEISATGTVAHDPELYLAIEEYKQTLKNGTSEKQMQALLQASRLKLQHMGLSDEVIASLESSDQTSLLVRQIGSPVWIYAQIYESEAHQVKVGQAFEVSLPSDSGKKWVGTIQSLDARVDSQTRTLKARGQIKDTSAELRPDMYVDVKIRIPIGNRLSVPAEAVFDTGSQQSVFVQKKNGEFEKRAVKLGLRGDDAVEIISGLKAGEKVAVGANFLLDSESKLKEIAK